MFVFSKIFFYIKIVNKGFSSFEWLLLCVVWSDHNDKAIDVL